MSEPTLYEVMRRLDEVAQRLERMAAETREDRRTLETTYLRAETWREARKADRDDVLALTRQLDEQRAWRRTITAWIAAPVCTSLIAVIFQLASVRGGG